jgi:L-seryl-tRNA(Ser) seleniumtransferase
VFWFHGALVKPGDIPLPEVIRITHKHDVPVVIDGAAQLPPASNLWYFTELGADLAIFSGGKDLRGPQSSGLVLGRKDLIEACRMHGNPNHAFGRPMKVGKEEMVGALAAVERYINLDHEARERYCETTVQQWCKSLNEIDGITAERSFPNEAGQPLPRCLVTIQPNIVGLERDAIMRALLEGEPGISVASYEQDGIFLNPMTLGQGEELVVQQRLIAVLTGS